MPNNQFVVTSYHGKYGQRPEKRRTLLGALLIAALGYGLMFVLLSLGR